MGTRRGPAAWEGTHRKGAEGGAGSAGHSQLLRPACGTQGGLQDEAGWEGWGVLRALNTLLRGLYLNWRKRDSGGSVEARGAARGHGAVVTVLRTVLQSGWSGCTVLVSYRTRLGSASPELQAARGTRGEDMKLLLKTRYHPGPCLWLCFFCFGWGKRVKCAKPFAN